MVNKSNRSRAGSRNFAKRARKDSDKSNERRDFTDLNDLNRSIEEISSSQQEQKETSLSTLKEFRNIGTQTEETANYRFTEIHKNFNNNNIRDIICILIDVIPNFGAGHYRLISMIVYLILRIFYFPWENVRIC